MVVACDVKETLRQEIIDTYFLYAVGPDTFNNDSMPELESVDNMINLLVGNDCDELYDSNELQPDEQKE